MCTSVPGENAPTLSSRSSSTPCQSGIAWMSHWMGGG